MLYLPLSRWRPQECPEAAAALQGPADAGPAVAEQPAAAAYLGSRRFGRWRAFIDVCGKAELPNPSPASLSIGSRGK